MSSSIELSHTGAGKSFQASLKAVPMYQGSVRMVQSDVLTLIDA